MIDYAELVRAVEALDIICRAGQEDELRDRISQDWNIARQERLELTPGREMNLSFVVRDILKIDREACDRAVDDYLKPSYQRVTLNCIFQFVAELTAPPVVKPMIPRVPQQRRGLVA
jgi:hypothetical protein